jgi:hypothetical protein
MPFDHGLLSTNKGDGTARIHMKKVDQNKKIVGWLSTKMVRRQSRELGG